LAACARRPTIGLVKLIVVHEEFFERLTVWYATGIRLALNLLLVITILALMVGIVKSGVDLFHSLREPLDTILQNVLLDVVFIVALVEITITILGYLKDGRVHVRYIVDTVLIIMLNEIVSMWFKHPRLENAISLSIIVAVLALVRISVTRFAPNHTD
jgi:uncharacterized membrane protein (DUF373 family)